NKLLELFSKIENDERHEFVTLLSFEEIMAREFEDWKMAFEDFSGDNHQLHYLKLLVAVFMEDDNGLVLPNPTSGKFWNATKLLLERKMGKGEWR
ncbi:MAG: BLUF domain-containing protein, partial [Maribacter sp.]